jgi:uncharacterized alkaline shock family protein YloU
VNVFNRVVVILLVLGIIFTMPILMIAPQPFIGILAQQLSYIEPLVDANTQMVIVLVGVIVLLLCALILWLELRRPSLRTVKLRGVSGGEAELTTDSVSQRLAYNIDQLADVVEVRPKVISKGKGVEVVLDLETSPDVDVPAKTEEVCQVARQVVEERMGLELRKIRVNIKHAPYPQRPVELS